MIFEEETDSGKNTGRGGLNQVANHCSPVELRDFPLQIRTVRKSGFRVVGVEVRNPEDGCVGTVPAIAADGLPANSGMP